MDGEEGHFLAKRFRKFWGLAEGRNAPIFVGTASEIWWREFFCDWFPSFWIANGRGYEKIKLNLLMKTARQKLILWP